MKRGDVVTVSLPGDAGKPRPAVIVQTDVLTETIRTVLLCPISSYSSDPSIFRVTLEPTLENGLRLPSEIMVDKLQAANRSKIGQIIGRLDDDNLRRLARSLTITLGLAEI
ncbi:mRNA interferase PemK [Aureimonas endophytica]|uniref:mRNA interferase PemK n=1 Tax=Aureimonas endophytica TaxID=2027858 RepID=A0A917A401_9HYPH|nr:type II toxin-antitoxin system PemK/MazF family toxin [Aureimonas endophytica]GGE23949.1 mRNA interferase PemK [Aureimonas endophytica]